MLALALLACGSGVDCSKPGALLVEGEASLTCAQGEDAVEYIELLAGRPVATGDEPLALAAIAERFRADPAGTHAWLGEVRQAGAALEQAEGMAGAEQRSRAVFLADAGKGLIGPDAGALWSVQQRALAVWARDEAEQVAVAESDLEAWIRFASLCREVQGAGVLRVSVADRVGVYKGLIDRFQRGDRAAKLALGAFGAVWPQVKDRWQGASYEEQQAWIQRAPLPPPMTATSLGYADALFQGDVAGLATTFYEVLGPFTVGGETRRFASAPVE